MPVCLNCGSVINDGSRFCATCGASVDAVENEALSIVQSSEPVTLQEPETSVLEISGTVLQPEPVQEAVSDVQPAEIPDSAPAFKPEPLPVITQPPPKAAEPEPVVTHPPKPEWRPPVREPMPQTPPPPRYAPAPNGYYNPEPPPNRQVAPIMTTWQYIGAIILMSIPVIGLLFMIPWAAGATRKIVKRNLARAYLTFIIIGMALLLIAGFVFLIFFFTDFTMWVDSIIAYLETEGFLRPGIYIDWGLFNAFIR